MPAPLPQHLNRNLLPCINYNRSINENIDEFPPGLKFDDPDIFESIDIVGSPGATVGDGNVNNANAVIFISAARTVFSLHAPRVQKREINFRSTNLH